MYTKGEVVWAKIKGFPWWPGVVAKVIEEKGASQNSIEVFDKFHWRKLPCSVIIGKSRKVPRQIRGVCQNEEKEIVGVYRNCQ